jgi:hypothetical protein
MGSGGIALIFLTSALDGGGRSASRSSCFSPGENLRSPLDRSQGGPQSQSSRFREVKNLPPQGIEPRLSSRSPHKIVVGKSERTETLGRPKCGWDDVFKMDLEGVGCEDVDWIHLAHDKVHCRTVVITVRNPLVLEKARKF